MKAFLTSAGFDNDNLVPIFYKLLGKPTKNMKALFIPTALNTPDAREYIHVFLEDLYKVGISDGNIDTYDLDEPFDSKKIMEYAIVFVCPGDTGFLLKKVNEMGFGKVLKTFFSNGGVYIGVSAGSDIFTLNLPDNLGYLNCKIECHTKEGSPVGRVFPEPSHVVKITDNQAIMIEDENITLVE